MWNKLMFVAQIVVLSLLVFVFIKIYGNDSKIAYVDTAKLMEKSKAIQDLQRQLKEDAKKTSANVDTLVMEFESSMKDYEKKSSSMSAKEKVLSQELLKTKQNQLLQYQQAVKQKIAQDEQTKMQEVLKSINLYISEYGKKQGYRIILATSNGNIAYADEALDITDDIIDGVNQ